MASTGARLAGTGTNVDLSGRTAWGNPTRITAADSSSATVFSQSDYLIGSNFTFSVPSGATINGVEVTFAASEAAAGNPTLTLQLQDDTGTLIGSSQTKVISGIPVTTYTVGSSSDLWGASLTDTIVNDVDFGVRIWYATAGSTDISIDWVKINIYYTAAGGSSVKALAALGVG